MKNKYAISKEGLQQFKKMLDVHGQELINTLIIEASNPNNIQPDILYAIAKVGIDITGVKIGKTPILEWALKNKDDNLVNAILRNTDLHIAAAQRNITIITDLIKAGEDVNSRDVNGQTPLHIAAEIGDLKVVKKLINKGADIGIKDKNGNTAINIAASNGHISIIESIAAKTQNPIFAASKKGDTKKVLELINKGEDINQKDLLGKTALHISASQGHAELTKILVDKGANVALQDIQGRTPLDIALSKNHDTIVDLLKPNTKESVIARDRSASTSRREI